MKKTFYSNGKLLLTAEYLVLNGAHALALPTKYGQFLHVESTASETIHWKSFENDGSIWFEATLRFDEILSKAQAEDPIKNMLCGILHHAALQNPGFLQGDTGFTITTELTFPRLWGLGTSSTLINNIAQWLEIDAFELLRTSFGGSGYDIACAQYDTAIDYSLQKDGRPLIKPISFELPFVRDLYFVYLNKKQNSRNAIADYKSKKVALSQAVHQVNAISEALPKCETLQEFSRLLQEHESLMSSVLQLPTVQTTLFADFPGTVKSLGAWGGDFILAASPKNPIDYFTDLGFPTVIPYQEIIK